MSATDEGFRIAALESFHNAGEILIDIGILFDHGRYARALSLAVIGREEVGKGILYVLAALGLVPGLRVALEGARANLNRSHIIKQVAAEIVGIADHLVDEYIDALRPEGSWVDPIWRCDQVLSQCAEWVLDTGVIGDRGGIRAFEQDHRELAEALDLGLRDAPLPPTLDGQKFAGLYVDLRQGSIITPKSIHELDARSRMIDLQADLGMTTEIREAIEDIELWEALARPERSGNRPNRLPNRGKPS